MHESTDPADMQPDDRLRELARIFASAYERFRRDGRAASDSDHPTRCPAQEETVSE
jgi:hypothetical protein